MEKEKRKLNNKALQRSADVKSIIFQESYQVSGVGEGSEL